MENYPIRSNNGNKRAIRQEQPVDWTIYMKEVGKAFSSAEGEPPHGSREYFKMAENYAVYGNGFTDFPENLAVLQSEDNNTTREVKPFCGRWIQGGHMTPAIPEAAMNLESRNIAEHALPPFESIQRITAPPPGFAYCSSSFQLEQSDNSQMETVGPIGSLPTGTSTATAEALCRAAFYGHK